MRPGTGKNLLVGYILIFVTLFFYSGEVRGQTGNRTAETGQAEVTFLQGKADVLPKAETGWKSLRVGSLLFQEDEVRTGEGARIEIRLPDRSIMRFDQRTTFKMKNLLFDSQEGSREVKVEIPVGKTWAGVRDTVWRMNVDADQSTLIRVYEGTVEVYHPFVKPDYKPEEGGFKAPREVRGPQEVPRPYGEVTKEQWEQIVLTQMMQVTVPAVGKPEAPTPFRLEEDQGEEWVRWNQQRDRQIIP
jgi:hypothetical protein